MLLPLDHTEVPDSPGHHAVGHNNNYYHHNQHVEDDDDDDDDDNYDDYELEADELIGYDDHWSEVTGDITKQFNQLRSQAQHDPAVGRIAPPAKLALAGGKTKELNKLASRIRLDDGSNFNASVSVANDIKLSAGKASGSARAPQKDKSDRATSEQVLDPRTRMILLKLLNQGVIYEINGCISTGKEANVYHAMTEDGLHRAIKIYKTSILVFKDRDRYVSGEFRFRHGYSRHNPRKMVRVWAEKEMRNLKRLHAAGIACPQPLLLRQHVLVMDFLGSDDGWAYPRLKDAPITSTSRYTKLYWQLVRDMRIMFQTCRLVHADLSEYNILYHAKSLYIIDVSQSVEHDHPYALDFLRHDCNNVTEYFRKHGVRVMSLRQLFDFITDTFGITDNSPGNITAELEKASIKDNLKDLDSEQLRQQMLDDQVFRQSYIPRTLQEVFDYERDVEKINRGEIDDIIYSKMVGFNIDGKAQLAGPAASEEDPQQDKAHQQQERPKLP
ncbi:Serine/threonine-protein kinase rio1, partial [Spiromyces aspiralis]